MKSANQPSGCNAQRSTVESNYLFSLYIHAGDFVIAQRPGEGHGRVSGCCARSPPRRDGQAGILFYLYRIRLYHTVSVGVLSRQKILIWYTRVRDSCSVQVLYSRYTATGTAYRRGNIYPGPKEIDSTETCCHMPCFKVGGASYVIARATACSSRPYLAVRARGDRLST